MEKYQFLKLNFPFHFLGRLRARWQPSSQGFILFVWDRSCQLGGFTAAVHTLLILFLLFVFSPHRVLPLLYPCLQSPLHQPLAVCPWPGSLTVPASVSPALLTYHVFLRGCVQNEMSEHSGSKEQSGHPESYLFLFALLSQAVPLAQDSGRTQIQTQAGGLSTAVHQDCSQQ